MPRHTVQDTLDWCNDEVRHRSRDWTHDCMMMTRTALGQDPWAYSARLAYYRIPREHRHYTLAKNVPAGAACFGLLNTNWGHAWIAGRGPSDGRIGFTVDYRRRGYVDRAPLSLPSWTSDYKVRWTDWSPYGMLRLWDDPWNLKNIPKPRH